MKPMFFIRCVLVSALLVSHQAHSARFAHGNGTYPQTFNASILSAVFSQANGTFYVGLGSGSTTTYAISSLARDSTSTPLFVTPLAKATGRPGNIVGALALAAAQDNPAPTLAGVPGLVTLSSASTTTLFALLHDGTNTVNSASLLAANPTLGQNGLTTSGIVALAANNDFMFAAVRPNNNTFGETNSGIAVVRIDYNLLQYPIKLSALIQTAAVEGDSGIKAKPLDPTVIEIFDPAANGTIENNVNFLYWDNPLQRLYAGLIVTSGIDDDDIARSVVVARVQPNGTLVYSPIAPNSAITPNLASDQREIVVGRSGVEPSENQFSLTVYNLNVLHASTGPSYLIVNGANGAPNTPGNQVGAKIFALPLVDLREPDGDIDPADDPIHGTLADKNSPLVNGKFVTPATAPGDLVTDPTLTMSGEDAFALVGGKPLPLFAADGTTTLNISDLVVVGDTVYVAIDITQSDTNETGILYSQAKFDQEGKIVGWTPWAKRGFPIDALPSPMNPGAIAFLGVDQVTGNITAVGDDQDRTIAVTTWDFGKEPLGLAATLNKLLTKGSYSVLDLDAYTRDFDQNTAQRYALFGGINKVIFTRVSESRVANNSNAPQRVFVDFTEEENLLDTPVPNAGGRISVLEYSRNEDNNYFFAGSANGLFAFAQSGGASFAVSELSTLDVPPFSTGSWMKVPNIPGAVIDIKTLGNRLYILTYTTSAAQPMQNTLYSVPFSSTINSMFASPTVIAQTNVGIFTGIYSFSGIQLIGTSDDSTTEQLVLATSKGLFKSSKGGGVQTALSQIDAAWSFIEGSDNNLYMGIAGMDPSVVLNANFTTGFPTTVWPFSMLDQKSRKTFTRSSIQQLSGTTNAGPYTFKPQQFNSNSLPAALANFPPISYFFSDGARRFFIVNNGQRSEKQASNELIVSPFDTFESNVSRIAQNFLFSPALTPCPTFTWVKQIGMTGILLAGTTTGVVALE